MQKSAQKTPSSNKNLPDLNDLRPLGIPTNNQGSSGGKRPSRIPTPAKRNRNKTKQYDPVTGR